MASKAVARKQAEIDEQVVNLLAQLGGTRTKDEEVEFAGTAFIFPENYRGDLKGIQNWINRYVEAQNEVVQVVKTFNYRPNDGAHATYQMLKKFFGYAQSKAKQGMFGPVPPEEIVIPTGFVDGRLQTMSIPWGDMVLPLVGAVMSMQINYETDMGPLFQLNTRCRKVHKEVIEGFYKAVEGYLEEHSLYRGHAVNGAMEFIDTDRVDPKQFVYSEQVWVDAEVHIFSPMRDRKILDGAGLDPKRVVLLEGPFGTGKSGLGRTASKVAVANGWTALICRPGQDDPFEVMRTARLYLPIEGKDTGGCMVFMEDIDVLSQQHNDPQYTSKLLDAFDGFETKGHPFVLVMTTNHAEEITQGMTRPGRIHGIISIGAMDRPGVEKLCKTVIGDKLDPDVDYDAVYAATEGYMPAFVREAIERSLRYVIARTGDVGIITTEDLVHACGSLRAQFDLHMAAEDRPGKLPALDQMLRNMITEQANIDPAIIQRTVRNAVQRSVDGAVLISEDSGDHEYTVRIP